MQCPIGPVPDPRLETMVITVFSRAPRPKEAAKAAEEAAAAEERRKAAAAEDAEVEAAFAEGFAAMEDDESDDDEEEDGGGEQEGAPTESVEAASAAAASAAASSESATAEPDPAESTAASSESATAEPGGESLTAAGLFGEDDGDGGSSAEAATTELAASTAIQPSGVQQNEGSAIERIEAVRKAAVQQAKQAGASVKKQNEAGWRARWDAVTHELCERGDLRATFKLSDTAYATQRTAFKKAYMAAVEARRSAGDEVPAKPYIDVEGEYTAITCGWKEYGGWAGREPAVRCRRG